MKHVYTRLFYLLILVMVLSTEKSLADGSKDMYPSTASGGRAKLRSSTGSSASYPFPTLNAHYTYAKEGELITMASSEMGTGNAAIKFTRPDGVETTYTTDGKINNRTAELAGPRAQGQTGGNFYTPIYYEVPIGGAGIYKIEFIAGGGANNINTNGRQDIAATDNWNSNGTNTCLISAWDVSVFDGITATAQPIKGRVYANVLNLDINAEFSNTRNFYATMNVLTKDGYIYKVNNNGNNGISFTFFVNNKGFIDASGQPIYKSLNRSTNIATAVQDPRIADTESGITHKMFYALPASDLPTTATGAVDGGTTWLKNPRIAPKVTNLNIIGVDGTIGQVSNKGGNVRFDANLAGRFTINITSTLPVGDPLHFKTKSIAGSATAGTNNVPWDGTDGDGNPLPNGAVPATLTVRLQGAEVHFPYFDMEINPNGLILQLLAVDNVSVQSDIVYWDDTDIPTRDIASNPKNASQFQIPAGTSSSSNGHKWGSNSSPTSGTFSDEKSMDTWTFILGAEEVKEIEVAVKKADLKVTSVTGDKSQIIIGDTIVYTVVVKNDGPSDVSAAPFAFNAPAGFEIVEVTPLSSCAVESNNVISADKQHYTAGLDLANQCEVTYTIKVKAVAPAAGPVIVDATILRPNDVTDPDATNPGINIPPTDPYYECTNNGLSVPCNNIKSNTTTTVINPAMTLIKSVTNTGSGTAGIFVIGDVMNYKFVVKNTGNVPLNTVQLTESLTGVTISGPTGDTGNDNILSVNEEWTYTGAYTVTIANANNGKVINQATVTAIDPLNNTITDLSGTAANNDTPTETPVLQIGKISLVKTVSSITPVTGYKLGDVITYTFTVKNEGNSVLKTIVLTDNITGVTITGPAVDAGNDGQLAVGEEWTFDGSYNISQADVDAGKISNVATVTSKDPANSTVSDISGTTATDDLPTETPISQSPAMKLTKSGVYDDTNSDGKVSIGDKINYTFKVENTGNVTLTNLSIEDANVSVTGTLATLAPGAVDLNTFAAEYSITQADIDKGGVYNIATVKGKDPNGSDVTDESENGNPNDPGTPAVDPACPTCTITALPLPAMKLTKSGIYDDTNNDGKVSIGDKINYTFRVENTGNVTLTDLSIEDANVTVTGTLATLAPGAVDVNTFTAEYSITQADIDKGGAYNIATVKGKDPKGADVTDDSENGNPGGPGTPAVDPACPTCTITTLPQSPAMKLTKSGVYDDTDNDGKVSIGDKINYTFKVENTGNVTLTDLSIEDANVTVTGTLATLAPGAVDVNTFTAQYSITQADLDKGGAYNIAIVKGKDPKGNDTTDESENGNPGGPGSPAVDPACPTCTITTLPQSPAMKLTKSGVYEDTDNDGKVSIGDKINYTFKVENTGNVTLTDLSIEDANVTVTGTLATLAPGAVDVNTFTAEYSITQADLDKGGVYNIAIVKGKDPKGNDTTDESENGNPNGPGTPAVDPACPTCTITALPQSPAMKLTKSGVYDDTNNDGKVNIGDKINYTFRVENTGNVTLTDLSIEDANVTVTGTLATLAPGAVDVNTFTAEYSITQADLDKGGAYNIATVKGKDPKGNDTTDESENGNPNGPGTPAVDPACPTCTITALPQSPAMTLTKTTLAGTYNKVGDIIHYNLVLTNTGNVTINNVAITDANADGGSISPANIATLAPNESETITAAHTVTQTDLDKGYVSNLAEADGDDPKGGDVHTGSKDPSPIPGAPTDPACHDCTITPVQQLPAISLVKKITNTGSGEGGMFVLNDQIEYTFSIKNTGNTTLTSIVLNDPLLGTAVINIPGSLAPGATVDHVERYTVTATDITNGKVTNEATVTANDPAGTEITDKSGTDGDNDEATEIIVAKPPVAKDDQSETQQNKPIKVQILGNDEEGSSDLVPGLVTIVTGPQHGTLTKNADGTITYTPEPGYTGDDEFVYTITDENGQISNPATAKVTVVPTEPEATDDVSETQFNTAVQIPVLNNDKQDGAPIDITTIEITENPQHGTLTRNPDGTITYLPNSGFTGTDTFKYRVKDENGNWTNVATASITIKGFMIPNVITPNGDGKNDNFVIVGLENFSNADLTIFNRWGNEVYRNNNYKNTWSAEGLNDGTYYYMIRMKGSGKEEVFKGWVLIKR